MVLKVLGSGCVNCQRLEEATKRAVAELDAEATVEKVTDINDIISYGVMTTPALVVDEKVVLAGRVPSVEEIKKILQRQ
ncbi:MAG: thioredoxin family protein [Anaerosomatales bacterium]|nr:thioredoxin family protein [Anaerosomatales bacterium]MDT8433932.1 thioredoxin family protein [Anaerosomatales bacterium]